MQSSTPAVTQKKASDLGCALDVNILTGASTKGAASATDDTAILNRFLATASATNPIVLIMDGASLVTGLLLSPAGYTTIQGSGDATGFFLKSGSNSDGIYTRDPGPYVFDPNSPAPARNCQQIALKQFQFNGNRGDGHSGNSTSGDPKIGTLYGFLIAINLISVDGLTIDQVTVLHASTYSIRLSNVGNVSVTNCRVMPFTPAETVGPNNTDGIHVDGPSNDIAISGCYFRTGDDAIALNAPEGYGGTIQRVRATDCTFDQCQLMMRIYSGSRSAALIQDVTVNGFSGTANVTPFLFGLDDRGGVLTVQDAVQNVLIENCQISGFIGFSIEDNVRDLTLRNVIWTPASDVASTMIATISHNINIGTLNLVQCTVRQTGPHQLAGYVISLEDNNDFTDRIGTITLDGVACTADPAGVEPALLSLLRLGKNGSVGTVTVTDVDSRRIPQLLDDSTAYARIGSVGGPGLLATGWKIPDHKTIAGTRYVSDETNLATENVGGIPHTLAKVK